MNRLFSMIIFVTIVTAIYFGIHLFVYKCLTASLVRAHTPRRILKWFLWLSGASFLANILLSRVFKIYTLSFYAYTWMGIISIAFTFFLLQFLAAKLFPSQARPIAIVTLAVIGVVTVISLVNGLAVPGVKRLVIPLNHLPPSMSGFTIVQLSDVHLDTYKPKDHIVKIVDRVNRLKPDLVVITGDLVDGSAAEEQIFCQHLKRLRATHGVLAVVGNHEFYSGLNKFIELAACANIKVLRNDTITIGDGLQIIGRDDRQARGFGYRRPELETLTAKCDPTKPIIYLYHRPTAFDRAADLGVDLQLSGHVHSGQLPPMDLLVHLWYKYPHGLYQKQTPNSTAYIYVTSGTGLWGPPMRFLSKNEIVHITLEPPKNQEKQ